MLRAQQKVLIAVSKVADGKIKVEWENPYGDSMVQLNVQQTKHWKTVKITVESQ